MRSSVVLGLPGSLADHSLRSSEIMSSPLPEWVWSNLERLYCSVFSSRAMLEKPKLRQTLPQAWIEKNDYLITDILLFRKEGCMIQVMNEVFALSPDVIERFSKVIFNNFPKIQFIQLHAIKLRSPFKSSLNFTSKFSEDYVLSNPGGKERWLASLSARTRERIRLYVRQATSEANGISLSISQRNEIDELSVRRILKLNQNRMRVKGKSYGMSPDEEDQLCKQMQTVGFLFVLKKNDDICGGLLCSVIGPNVYIHVLAHDPKFDSMRLGWVCCYLTVENLIMQGYKEIHFLWGHYEYKKKLGAKPISLYRVLVSKNYCESLLHPVILVRWCWNAFRDIVRKYRYGIKNRTAVR